ncbi:hypothetical protein LXL04_030561 [Taraxacum kok-saghyz]
MDFSQPRPYGAQGANPTHDFLSLYPPAQQDPTPTIPGGYLKTHDFLHVKEGNNNKFHQTATYSVSQISSYMNQIQTQKVPKAEGIETSGAQSSGSNNNDENSNCSSGFTIWEESKGKSGKIGNGVPWMTSHCTSSVKVDGGQRPNSPRSKHSATEQRRRSKINDRFSMLRGIIPHADKKRDKASFLLEVIEYIQFLQEKVHKYEDSYQGRKNKHPKMIPLNNRQTNQSEPSDAIIGVSSMYSQGISNTLTEALKSSGVDLSEANISVQIDLGKRSITNLEDNEILSIEESGEGLKRRRY